jgi:hypothetical protein
LEDLTGFGYVFFAEVFLGCAWFLLGDEKREYFPFPDLSTLGKLRYHQGRVRSRETGQYPDNEDMRRDFDEPSL